MGLHGFWEMDRLPFYPFLPLWNNFAYPALGWRTMLLLLFMKHNSAPKPSEIHGNRQDGLVCFLLFGLTEWANFNDI